MASLHGRSNVYSPEPYHFFKIVLECTIREGKLGFPRKFVRDYGNALSSPVFLKVPNGEVWEVELTKRDGKIWLQNGWQKFADHYSLKFGHFLVFRYEGNCRFQVLIFDRSASEIQYPLKIEESEEDDTVEIINNFSTGKREKPVLQSPRSQKMMRASPSDETKRSLKYESVAARFGRHNNGFSAGKGKVRSTSVCHVKQVKSDEKSKALRRARTAFQSENPFFLVFMQPTYVGLHSIGSCYLGIPQEFARKYLMDHGDVILCDSNGKTWSAKYCSSPGSKLCHGWGAFVRDNNLQVGDVCAFELIDSIDISFQVFIYWGKKVDFHRSQAFTDVSCPAKREAAGISSTHRGCLEQPLKVRETALQRAMKAREKALLRGLAFTSENPFFLVVLRPSYVRTHALCISDKFARKHFKSTLTNVNVALCLSNGKSWPAEYHQRSIGRPNARICNGWRAFVKDNKLKVGDICVLEMMNSNDTQISFKVVIFQAIADDGYCHPSQGDSQDLLDLTSQSPKAAREKASVSVPPFFRRVVLPLHLKEHRMDIPFRFLEQYFKPNIQKLILQVADRSWAVKIKSNLRFHIAKLTSGWIEFARENSLREGDVCVYELDTIGNNLLKVSISKCGH